MSLSPHFLRAVIYLNIQVVKGQRKVICLLKEQIRNVSPACVVSGSVHLASGVPLGTPVLVLLLLEIGFLSVAQVVLYTENDVGFLVSIVDVVPGIAPRTLCVLGKHSTS